MSTVIAFPAAAAAAPLTVLVRTVARPALAAGLVAGTVAAAGTVLLTEIFGVSVGSRSVPRTTPTVPEPFATPRSHPLHVA